MKYKSKEQVKARILEDIEEIQEFDNVGHFIDANFMQFLTHGEYDDNSIELSYQYKMLKRIAADKEFFDKLNFVMSKYIGALANER